MNLLAVLRCEEGEREKEREREGGFLYHHTAEVFRCKVRNPGLVLFTRIMIVRKEKQIFFERYL